MKWIETTVRYTDVVGLLCAEIVADLFYDMGLHGVLLQDPFQESGQPDSADGPQAAGAGQVTGYLPDNASGRQRCEQLRRRLQQLDFPTRLRLAVIDDQDWSRLWKTHFKPLMVSPGLVVKPSWEKYPQGKGETVIEIDPGMAFGTGHHPTTVLCMQLIRSYVQPGGTLLDVGTGTGILAITAVKSGCRKVVALDSDEAAVAAAKKNRRRNHIGPRRLLLLCGNLVEPVKGMFQVVVANIVPDAIRMLMEGLERNLEPGGLFIASGIPDEKAGALIRAAESRSYVKQAVQSLEGWTAFAVRRPH